ncbi:acireductone synthase [Komagataeibacter nataicola]|uniref:Enolase-phosphatase E1 n=1 Tax=Komagataeibacter nataicola TaxID=265960 RepID=A0A9N7H0D7_9PROT|nr:acireductone synthase [Komagataeibacter nataicola]AQU87224.1 acireductone synthase [Komagataeibacter nataicola]PYD67514.1 acireductone synthase [Komagataeibacter nataicola]GBR14614.1 2,3-diketo-5-methylthio-1-phosphopentane phosphatase [Komagataeibacter nataicola NRIC 0616]
MTQATRPPVRAVLLDIEGTTIPVSFVHATLFPYARKALPALLRTHADDPAVKAQIAEIAHLAPGVPPLRQLEAWMDADAKVAPLKALQGMVWAQGYAEGVLKAALYPDVVPALRCWAAAGLSLAVYSSGSVAAQKLIYGHTTEGDLSSVFVGFYDLEMGGKRDAESYRRILDAARWQAGDVLFLSDVVAELDAAAAAGLRTCQIVHPEDGTQPGTTHPVAGSLAEVAMRFGLPHPEVA